MSKKQQAGQRKSVAKNKPAGLTTGEKKRLVELKRTLAGNDKQQAKPTTAQKTITFERMYQDGICQVTKNYYTKMVEFYDLNYGLLDEEEQVEILELYSQLINYFDPSIKFQIVLFNRQVNEQTLVEQFDIPMQNDDFDEIRLEFSEMLKKQSAKGNNGIQKSKYLIFGTECASVKEARAKLNNIEFDVIKNFRNVGTDATPLNGKERLRILHASLCRELEHYKNRKVSGRKKYDEAWMTSYNDFVVKYESGMSIMEIVNEGEISRRTAYRYKAYYDATKK